MRLVRPEWLFGWGVLPVLAILIVVAMIRQRAILVRLGEMSTVARLAGSASPERRGIKAALILVGGFFLIAAMAQPQWGRRSEPVFQRGVDVFVALDVSTSMLSQDVAPNRLARGKAFISKLLNQLEGDRIGLIAVAGSAFVQCPLTLDRAAARLFLDILDVGDVPDPGS
ncbi:MAG: VWA domain-containing protein, partial [Acidobacteriota bacterium]